MNGFQIVEIRGLFFFSALDMERLELLAAAHLVSYSAAPLDHLWNGVRVGAFAFSPDGINDSGIGLQSI